LILQYIHVASAEKDAWADPVSEMLTCVVISDEYEKYDKKGLVCEDRLPVVGDECHEGSIGYHMRAGNHYLSREDLLKVIKYVKKHSNI